MKLRGFSTLYMHTMGQYGKKTKQGFRDQMKRSRVEMCHGMQMVASMFHAVALIPFSFIAIMDVRFAPFRGSELQEISQGVELGDRWSRRRKTLAEKLRGVGGRENVI